MSIMTHYLCYKVNKMVRVCIDHCVLNDLILFTNSYRLEFVADPLLHSKQNGKNTHQRLHFEQSNTFYEFTQIGLRAF